MKNRAGLLFAAATLASASCTGSDEGNDANGTAQEPTELAEPPADLAEHPDLANQAAAAEAADAAIGGDVNAEEVSAAGNGQ